MTVNTIPDADCPSFDAGYEYVDKRLYTADDRQRVMWHGWALREAYWQGWKDGRDAEKVVK